MTQEENITERYNKETGQVEIRCAKCGNAEDIPTRIRKRHEHGPYLPPWTAARSPTLFSYGAGASCMQRGKVEKQEIVCSKCGNISWDM